MKPTTETATSKILFVDDDGSLLAGVQRALRRQFDIDIAEGGAAGLEIIKRDGPYAVVVADMQMPGMTGLEFLKRLQALAPDTIRLMLTGNTGQKTAADAVNDGRVFRFLSKPCPANVLVPSLEAALAQYRLVRSERDLLERTLNGSTKVLLDILSVVDPVSFGRSQRLVELMRRFVGAQAQAGSWELELAAMLSPIGYVAIPAPLVAKSWRNAALESTETEALARVPEIGADLIANIPRLETVARIVRYQAKNFDGSGFPADGIAGDEIPLGSRILRVLNDLALLESRKVPLHQAFDQMQKLAGRYDPAVLQAIAADFDFAIKQSPGQVKQIGWSDLREGQRVVADLLTADGVVIAPAETTVSGILIRRIRNIAQLSGIQEPIQIAA